MTRLAKTAPNVIPAIQRGGWLDALRFIVAALIIVHHFQKAGPFPLEALHPVFERGYFLTNFFLIDSGYVLARIYGEQMARGQMGLGDFFQKRVARLLPCHFAMMFALIALVVASAAAGLTPRHAEWFDWSQLPAQFFLVQSYGVPGGLGWNAPTWSISALLGCYLAFPYLIRLSGRVSPTALLLGAVALYAAANLATWRLLDYPVYQMPLKHGFLRALPLFILGVAMARFAEKVYLPARVMAPLGLFAAAAFCVLQYFGPYSLLCTALTCLIVLAAGACPVAKPSKLVEKAALVSFAMFISNEVVRIAYFGVANVVIAKLALPVAAQWAIWAGGMVSAVVFATAFYFVVDLPTQKLMKSLLRRPLLAGLRQALAGALPRPEMADAALGRRQTRYLEVRVSRGCVTL